MRAPAARSLGTLWCHEPAWRPVAERSRSAWMAGAGRATRSPRRNRARPPAGRGEDRELAHGVDMAARAGLGLVHATHRQAGLEDGVTLAASILIQRHCLRLSEHAGQ